MKIEKNCEICNNSFLTLLCRIKEGRGKYCSWKCSRFARRKKIEKTCTQCNKKFEIIQSRAGKEKNCSRKCMGEAKKGKPTWFSKRIRKGICLNTGRTWFKEGLIPWNKGTVKTIKCKKNRERKAICHFCNNEFFLKKGHLEQRHCNRQCWNKCDCKYYKHSEESKVKLSGLNHYNWKGGDDNPLRKLRSSFEYKTWRKEVYKRDYWTCQICKIKRQKINANHMYPFADYPDERFEIKNGVTLCETCHEFFRNKEKDFISWWEFYKETKWLSSFKFIEVYSKGENL